MATLSPPRGSASVSKVEVENSQSLPQFASASTDVIFDFRVFCLALLQALLPPVALVVGSGIRRDFAARFPSFRALEYAVWVPTWAVLVYCMATAPVPGEILRDPATVHLLVVHAVTSVVFAAIAACGTGARYLALRSGYLTKLDSSLCTLVVDADCDLTEDDEGDGMCPPPPPHTGQKRVALECYEALHGLDPWWTRSVGVVCRTDHSGGEKGGEKERERESARARPQGELHGITWIM